MMASPRVIGLLNRVAEGAGPEYRQELLEAVEFLSEYPLMSALKQEVEYVLENLQDNEGWADTPDEDKYYSNIELTKEQIDEIATIAWDSDWLSEQLYDSVRDAIDQHIGEQEDKKGDDFNE